MRFLSKSKFHPEVDLLQANIDLSITPSGTNMDSTEHVFIICCTEEEIEPYTG